MRIKKLFLGVIALWLLVSSYAPATVLAGQSAGSPGSGTAQFPIQISDDFIFTATFQDTANIRLSVTSRSNAFAPISDIRYFDSVADDSTQRYSSTTDTCGTNESDIEMGDADLNEDPATADIRIAVQRTNTSGCTFFVGTDINIANPTLGGVRRGSIHFYRRGTQIVFADGAKIYESGRPGYPADTFVRIQSSDGGGLGACPTILANIGTPNASNIFSLAEQPREADSAGGCQNNGNAQARTGVDLDRAGGTSPTGTDPFSNPGGGSGSLGSAEGDQNPTCETSGTSPITWFICPILNGALDATDWFFRVVIEPFLRVSPVTTESDDPIYQIWTSFRTLGNIVLIFGLLFIVFGQSIGGGMVDAYTAKKALPRILVAAVLINLSIYIAAVLIDIFNILGMGIGQLITSPLRGSGNFNFQPFSSGSSGFLVNTGLLLSVVFGGAWLASIFTRNSTTPISGTPLPGLGDGAGSTGGGGAVAAGGSFLPFLLLFIVLPIFLAVLGVFGTLIIRRGIIIFAVIIAPIALALYCLPATEKYTKKWFDLFIKTLMVYPIIIAFFAIGDVLSTVLFQANEGSILGELVAVIVLFIPMFMIPFAFKLAGGVVGTIYGTVTGIGKKGSEMVKGSEHNPHSMRNRAKGNALETATRYQARAVIGGRALNASTGKRRLGRIASKFGNVDARLSQFNADSAKAMEQQTSTGDDALIYAAMGWKQEQNEYEADGTTLKFKAGSYYSGKLDDNGNHKEISGDEFKQGKKYYGSGVADIGNVLRYRLGKAQTDKDVGAMRTAVEKNAIADNWTDGELKGVWAAATYPHKDKFGVEWYSAPSVVKDSTGRTTGVTFNDVGKDPKAMNKLLGDKHKTQQAFQLGSMRDDQWRAIDRQQQVLSSKLASKQTLDPVEAQNFAMASEIIDAVAMSPNVMYGDDNKPQVSGVSAASKGVIEAMIMNRQYTVTKSASATVPGQVSANERDIVEYGDNPRYGLPQTDPNYLPNQQRKTTGRAVQTNIPVTGDSERTGVPGAA